MTIELDDILRHIAKVAPTLTDEAGPAEQLRCATPELASALRDSQVPMSKVPVAAGGYELDYVEQLRVFDELAYLNPTAGWIGFVAAGTAGTAGAFLADEGVATVFSNGVPLMAGVAAASGTYTPVAGGHRVAGTWKFASGVQVADWIMVGAADGSGDTRTNKVLTLPTSALTMHDNWFTASLQGTGSIDVTIDDVVVPENMSFDMFGPPLRGGSQYSAGIFGNAGPELLGFAIGVGRRIFDEVGRMATSKKRGMDTNPLAERGAFQYEYGKADMQMRAARSLAESVLTDTYAALDQHGGPLQRRQNAELGATMAFVIASIADAATTLYHFSGASAMSLQSPIQRCFRDLHGATQHYLAANSSLDKHGRVMLESHSA